MNTRTTREFQYNGNLSQVLDAWAARNNYRLLETNGNTRRYQNGYGLFVAPTKLEITANGSNVRLETWIRSQLIARIFAFFIIPEEMHLESGGFVLSLPRKISRDVINILLNDLGQPLIP